MDHCNLKANQLAQNYRVRTVQLVPTVHLIICLPHLRNIYNSHKRGCVNIDYVSTTSNNVSSCHRALMNHCSYLPLNPYWYSAGPLLFRAESFDHQPPLYQRTVTHGLWWPSHAQHHHFWIAVIHFTCIRLFVLISQKTFLHISNKLASNDMWIVCV